MFKKFFIVNPYSRLINIALLILRVGIGILMLTHGWAKLEKVFAGNFNFSDPIGLGSITSLILTIFAEFFCSILIALGMGTRLATIPLIITMSVILFFVHGIGSVFTHYNVSLYFTGYILLLITGSGKYSLDYYLIKGNRLSN